MLARTVSVASEGMTRVVTSTLRQTVCRPALRRQLDLHTASSPRLYGDMPTSRTAISSTRIAARQRQRSCGESSASGRRTFHATVRQEHGGIHRPEPGTGVKVTFRDSKGNDIKTVEANEGDDLLSIAHEYDVDLEGAWVYMSVGRGKTDG